MLRGVRRLVLPRWSLCRSVGRGRRRRAGLPRRARFRRSAGDRAGQRARRRVRRRRDADGHDPARDRLGRSFSVRPACARRRDRRARGLERRPADRAPPGPRRALARRRPERRLRRMALADDPARRQARPDRPRRAGARSARATRRRLRALARVAPDSPAARPHGRPRSASHAGGDEEGIPGDAVARRRGAGCHGERPDSRRRDLHARRDRVASDSR